jgi:hypothetical protein
VVIRGINSQSRRKTTIGAVSQNCVMSRPPKLHVTIWGISVNAEGALAIGAAFIIVMSVLAFYRF